jgi:hypothetical protein
MRRLLLASPIIAIVAVVVALAAVLSNMGSSTPTEDSDEVFATALSRTQVTDWMSAGGLPSGARIITASTASTVKADENHVVYLRGWCVDVGGTGVEVSLTIVHTLATDSWAPAGHPSVALAPLAYTNQPDTKAVWGDARTVTPTEPAKAAVTAWAKAYFSGDPVLLQQTISDPNANHHYTPMAGATIIGTPTVTAAGAAPSNSNQAPTVVFASVLVNVAWPCPASDRGCDPPTVRLAFDVRIDQAASQSPSVTAWGAAGSGPLLAQWGNAHTVNVVVNTPPPPTALPSSDPPAAPPPTQEQTPPVAPGEPTPTDPSETGS